MREYQTLHLQTQINVKEQLVVRKVMDVNKHKGNNMRDYQTLQLDTN